MGPRGPVGASGFDIPAAVGAGRVLWPDGSWALAVDLAAKSGPGNSEVSLPPAAPGRHRAEKGRLRLAPVEVERCSSWARVVDPCPRVACPSVYLKADPVPVVAAVPCRPGSLNSSRAAQGREMLQRPASHRLTRRAEAAAGVSATGSGGAATSGHTSAAGSPTGAHSHATRSLLAPTRPRSMSLTCLDCGSLIGQLATHSTWGISCISCSGLFLYRPGSLNSSRTVQERLGSQRDVPTG